ncbi:sensory box/GGDEF family protein [Candidatus Velamenicoccus archaeovorus]|uniref:diguanylate cyclase n=1 Tax=Velamenicoccus archaeovorus TaxID=1930593 RepID=A0A410P6R1_VELA1|nr:diguanylate cyclase [Candidatus Velamenicoccus archaeovorus]QAT17758.1 sensory box/GGDEF family protein [Candidatus Velamenicoccus archaeovorus]
MQQSAEILLIEDESEASEKLGAVLYAAGHNVNVASSAKEGLKLLKDLKCAVVITELRLPDMGGVELIRAIKNMDAKISAVVITPYLFINSAIEAMENGAFGYITKPFNPSEIRIVVQHAVERYFLMDEANKKSYYYDLSILDGLTGVYNHRYLHEILDRELMRARRYPQSLSLIMVDVDNFKKYNDTNGHMAGDELLKGLTNLFVRSLRNLDMVFRYGGEEFCILLIETNKDGARLAAERLLNLVRLSLPATISMGIAEFPTDSKEKDMLIDKADKALYQAKTTGKNKVILA